MKRRRWPALLFQGLWRRQCRLLPEPALPARAWVVQGAAVLQAVALPVVVLLRQALKVAALPVVLLLGQVLKVAALPALAVRPRALAEQARRVAKALREAEAVCR